MLIPVILCGGKGTRLWPLSNNSKPKPFVPLPDGETLFYKALKRAFQLPNSEKIVIVTGSPWLEWMEYTLSLFPKERSRVVILSEPSSKNTAPALAAACFWAKAQGYMDADMLLLTADHLITPDEALVASVEELLKSKQEGHWVLFGIEPLYPALGYGYIEAPKLGESKIRPVKRFVEKPNLLVAQKMLSDGNYFWNSGMLFFSLKSGIQAFQDYHPEIAGLFEALPVVFYKQKTVAFPQELYDQLPNISSDYALLEKYPHLSLYPAPFAWSDIGSWEIFSKLLPHDEADNYGLRPAALFLKSKNNIFFSSQTNKLFVGFGIEDLLVIDTPEVMLVCPKSKLQDWRTLYESLEKASPFVKSKL